MPLNAMQVPPAEQRAAFDRPPEGKRKVRVVIVMVVLADGIVMAIKSCPADKLCIFIISIFPSLHLSVAPHCHLSLCRAPSPHQVILSTNIAETSVTIDDVVFVVDGGKSKEKYFEPARNISSMRVQVSGSSSVCR
ncbi:unnamed protein product [Closterium sp. NIES-54]